MNYIKYQVVYHINPKSLICHLIPTPLNFPSKILAHDLYLGLFQTFDLIFNSFHLFAIINNFVKTM